MYNNLNFQNSFRNSWEKHYVDAAKNMGADFLNYSYDKKSEISKKWGSYLSEAENSIKIVHEIPEMKENQCAMFDALDNCFQQGYDRVINIDSDLILNSKSNLFKNCDIENVYCEHAYADGISHKKEWNWGSWMRVQRVLEQGKDNEIDFQMSMFLESALENKIFKYGNLGFVSIHKECWNKLRNYLVDPKLIMSKIKEKHHGLFFLMSDQAILSAALTLSGVKLEEYKYSERLNMFVHFLEPFISYYKFFYNISEDYMQETHKKHAPIGTKDKHARWIPLLYHYINLTQEKQDALWPLSTGFLKLVKSHSSISRELSKTKESLSFLSSLAK